MRLCLFLILLIHILVLALKFKTTILCTGGAISFFTGDQAPINNFIDKLYLGWLVRLVFNPLIFFKRYIRGLRLIPMVFFDKIKVINL